MPDITCRLNVSQRIIQNGWANFTVARRVFYIYFLTLKNKEIKEKISPDLYAHVTFGIAKLNTQIHWQWITQGSDTTVIGTCIARQNPHKSGDKNKRGSKDNIPALISGSARNVQGNHTSVSFFISRYHHRSSIAVLIPLHKYSGPDFQSWACTCSDACACWGFVCISGAWINKCVQFPSLSTYMYSS